MPAISFLVYAEITLNIKRSFNFHWALISGSVMVTRDRVLCNEI